MALGFWMNNKNCYGCKTCSIACKSEKQLDQGVLLRHVTEIKQDDPRALSFLSLSCNHCDEPACVANCPVQAYTKLENGIVQQNHDLCIGCKTCIEACPYGVRVYNDGEPAYALDFAVGYPDAPAHLANTVEKCTLCANLIKQDQQPMCVQACVGYARYFGDLDDPDSEVSKLVASRESVQLLAEQGTDPSVYYLK